MSMFEQITWFACFISGLFSFTFVVLGLIEFERGTADPEKLFYLFIFLALGAISWAFAVVIHRLCKRG